jgi:DNA (cytosine-5)-methyltransferase 1
MREIAEIEKTENRFGMKELPSNGLTMIDLFCGAGIGATGFKLAGFEILHAIDNQSYAVNTYNENIGNHAVVGDIRLVSGTDLPNADVITGGFPCKPFSLIGKGEGTADEKNGDLGHHFFRIIEEKRPKAFLMENVGGLLTKKHRSFFDELVAKFEATGYVVKWSYLDVWEFGVPQKRKRVFAVGIRSDLQTSYSFPLPIPVENRTTIRDAIGDLPEPGEETTVANHVGYGIRNDEAPFVCAIPPGGNWRALPEDAQRVFLGNAFNSGGGRTGFLRKVSFSNPAWTITSCMNGKNNAQIVDLQDKYPEGVIEGNRRFTVRECLRLQTVPDWFRFSDDVSIAKQYERCSGIPSLMAQKLGIELAKALGSEQEVNGKNSNALIIDNSQLINITE